MRANIMHDGRNRRALRAASEVFHPRPKTWRASTGLALLVVCVVVGGMVLLFGVRAHGEEVAPECAADYDGPRRATLDHEGRPGIWFAAPVARCMLADLSELLVLRHRAELLGERLELQETQLTRLREIADVGQQAEQIALEGLDIAVEARRQAESTALLWWRSPALWLTVGAVVGVALVTLSAKVFDWTR